MNASTLMPVQLGEVARVSSNSSAMLAQLLAATWQGRLEVRALDISHGASCIQDDTGDSSTQSIESLDASTQHLQCGMLL